MTTSTDRIEKQIFLRAPRSRVWRALVNGDEFGRWFKVKLEGGFAPGALVQGQVTYPGYEHLRFEVTVERMEPERLFSWRWHPAPVDPGEDYASEPTTFVVFQLEEVEGGTLLSVVESGFEAIPPARRAKARGTNDEGWAEQMKNIERHVGKTS
jgi:uncharacterized protein YndB with AHSA1/START domain